MIEIGKNQFLLSYSNKEIICDSQIQFAGMELYLGPDCSCRYAYDGNIEAVVIGYATDCRDPRKNTDDFSKELLEKLRGGRLLKDDFLDYWGGRYCVIISLNRRLICFGDCCALRQVFFVNDLSKEIGFASQARYLAVAFGFAPDNEAQDYICRAKETDKEYSLPLWGTRYKEIERVLPNHFFDSDKKRQGRMAFYYADGDIKEPMSAISRFLANQMKHVSENYRCAVTLTAGLDSRMVFAHSLDCDDLEYVTLKYIDAKDDAEDIVVPRLLCKQYQKKHKIIPCDNVDRAFAQKYEAHSEDAHEYWIQMSYGIYSHNYGDRLWVKGSCNEIMQFSSGVLPKRSVNAKVICKLFGIPYCDFSRRIIEGWLAESGEFAEKNKIDLLNLFYWEHRMGSWLAECLNEQDVVGETFTPFNVRKILLLMNGFSMKSRVAPDYYVYKEIIGGVSRELLDVPVNRGRYDTVRSKIRCFIKYRCPAVYAMLSART